MHTGKTKLWLISKQGAAVAESLPGKCLLLRGCGEG